MDGKDKNDKPLLQVIKSGSNRPPPLSNAEIARARAMLADLARITQHCPLARKVAAEG